VLSMLICQLLIRTNLYEEINITSLKKNMILSSTSSMIMQGTRIKNMPGLSCEDLRYRLTEEEISAVKIWAKSRNISTIYVVKKIPFSLFLFMGFVVYFGLWSCVK
jgi:hypothetical protein